MRKALAALLFLLATVHVYRSIADTWFLATQIFFAINLFVVAVTTICLLRSQVRIRPFLLVLYLAPLGIFIVYLAMKNGSKP